MIKMDGGSIDESGFASTTVKVLIDDSSTCPLVVQSSLHIRSTDGQTFQDASEGKQNVGLGSWVSLIPRLKVKISPSSVGISTTIGLCPPDIATRVEVVNLRCSTHGYTS